MYTDEWTEVDLYRRDDLTIGRHRHRAGHHRRANATTVLDPGWSARVTEHNHLMLERTSPRRQDDVDTEVDPVMLELFNNLFMSIAEQMGERLRATANSVNIKERLDFSCALFDPDGHLIANAPHARPPGLDGVDRSGHRREPEASDPETPTCSTTLTTAEPICRHNRGHTGLRPSRRAHLFYVASRGHHAEIGGISPGSMPAFSTTVDEEGVLIDNHLLTQDGRMREQETLDMLTSGRYPSRNPENNLADLRAMLAANEKGVAELGGLVDEFGLDVVHAYMGHVRQNAEEAVRGSSRPCATAVTATSSTPAPSSRWR